MSIPETSPIQAPAGVVKSGLEPAIFTMPDRYRDGASGTVMTEPKSAAPQTPAVQKPLPPPAPKPVGGVPLHGKSHPKVLVLVGAGVLLVLGIAGLFLYRAAIAPKTGAPLASVPTPVPTPEPEPTPVPVPVPVPAPPEPVAVRSGADADSDGLTDVEETILYGTDPHLPDTDADGFLDGNEVFHLYNPKALAPGALREAGLTRPYSVTAADGVASLPYSIDYPTPWTPSADAANPTTVIFTASTGETITLSLQAKTLPDQTLADWYAAQNLVGGRGAITKGGVSTVVSDDQLTTYADAHGQVIVFRYDRGIKGTVDYLQTFKMMLNSLHVK